jgi:hypothetical protein
MAKNPRIDRDWRDPIRKSEIATDFGISLARIQWDIFATPTFAGNVPRTQIAFGLAFRWLQELAKVCGVPYNRLLIALRGEVGEVNGRFHFHCLVGGTATRNYHTLQHQAVLIGVTEMVDTHLHSYGAINGFGPAQGPLWPVSGELRLRNGAAEERINGGCKVVVDRATERSEAGRNSPESGTLGGAQSFGVTESATVSPKVYAPGEIRFCRE